MEKLYWTPTQLTRLKELDAEPEQMTIGFSTPAERNQIFQEIEKTLAKTRRNELSDRLTQARPSRMAALEMTLAATLQAEGFTRVSTPAIITRAALARMTIDEHHPLFKQVYWINEKQCLRPMLAPNLYSLMIDFSRLPVRPVRFYEMGSCFRKESDGARHNSEFTMLNLVEMGTPETDRLDRLKELAERVADAAGVTRFCFEEEASEVYGTTLDLVTDSGGLELGSGAMGPHSLDAAWGITDTWVGMGFGVERLLMAATGDMTIGKWGKSISYIDGMRLKF